MLGFLGWLAFSAVLFVFFFYKRIVEQQTEHATSRELVLAANGSLDLLQVLNTALDGVFSLLKMDAGAIHLYNEQEKCMDLYVVKGFSPEFSERLVSISLNTADCMISRVALEQKAIFLSDIRKIEQSPFLLAALQSGIKSVACIPIFIRGELIGTLLVNSNKKFRFHADNKITLNNLGHALGLAVEKVRLYERVNRDKHRMGVINEVTKIINSSLDLPTIYDDFAQKIKEVIDYDRCLIVLAQDKGQKAKIFLLSPSQKTVLPDGLVVAAANTSLEWVMQNNKAQFEYDFEKTRLFPEDETLLKEGHRSAVRVPICSQNEIIGIFILNSKTPNKYNEEDLEILEPIAEHLALALDKYFLFQRVSALSLTDELTSCGNRRLLNREMEREIKRADRYERSLGLIILDIDHFKIINDTYGHIAGDQILKSLGQLIQDETREIDTCIRYGGEEFIVLLPETNLEGTMLVAEKIRHSVSVTSFQADDTAHTLTISLGVAIYPHQAANGKQLIKNADNALYQAKKKGRNRTLAYNQ
jgi:diguanylate cyclase (GGDEF)-like protein